jgi:hypothetical protein
MAKIPSFNFYSQDFLIGCADMTMEERGQYITLLCLQHQKGHLSAKAIMLGIGLPPDKIPDVMRKFKTDIDGLFYNERLEQEAVKKSKYIQHQIDNVNKRWHPDTGESDNGIDLVNTKDIPLEIEIEIRNSNKNIEEEKEINKKEKNLRLLNERKKQFAVQISQFKSQYPDNMLLKFYNYWSEMNKSGTQMRYEMEKTWELARRLTTWASRDNDFQKPQDIISYKELIERFNKGEADMWEKYEATQINGKKMWKRKPTSV